MRKVRYVLLRITSRDANLAVYVDSEKLEWSLLKVLYHAIVTNYQPTSPTDKRRTSSATIRNLFRLRRSDLTYDRSRWRHSCGRMGCSGCRVEGTERLALGELRLCGGSGIGMVGHGLGMMADVEPGAAMYWMALLH